MMWQEIKLPEVVKNFQRPWVDSTGWPSNYARPYKFAYKVADKWYVSIAHLSAFFPKSRHFSQSITAIQWKELESGLDIPRD